MRIQHFSDDDITQAVDASQLLIQYRLLVTYIHMLQATGVIDTTVLAGPLGTIINGKGAQTLEVSKQRWGRYIDEFETQ